MGIVYGPYDQADWYTMKALMEDISFCKKTNPVKYALAIKYERDTLRREFYSRQAA